MSEFGGLWKHEETQHALKSGIILSLLTAATIRKEEEEEEGRTDTEGQITLGNTLQSDIGKLW